MKTIDINSPFINAQALTQLLNNDQIKIFDVRGKWSSPPTAAIEDYQQSHIPGALFLDWTHHFLEDNVPTNLAAIAPRQKAQKAFHELGIDTDDTVILYDDYHHMLAGRVWWSMRYWGFKDVKVLNGGWQHWINKNLPTTDVVPTVKKGSFKVNKQSELKSSLDQVINKTETTSLLDARGAVYYQGNADEPRSGHIKGAINLPYSMVLDESTGLFKEADELHQLFNNVIGNYSTTEVIASCGSGYAATVLLLALKSLGVNAPLFDDSFSIWKQDPSRPIEQSRH